MVDFGRMVHFGTLAVIMQQLALALQGTFAHAADQQKVLLAEFSLRQLFCTNTRSILP